MNIRLYNHSDKEAWDRFVMGHANATHCHLSRWKDVIERVYGHKAYYLIAEDEGRVVGLFPLIHIKSLIFGNQLVSMPFLNYGGILASSEEAEKTLLREATELGRRLGVKNLEIRSISFASCLRENGSPDPISSQALQPSPNWDERTDKVRMVLELSGGLDLLFHTLGSKLRSQIRRPQKEGMKMVIGGSEHLSEFYRVFSTNMRDLGSPVHPKRLFQEILDQFDEDVKIGIVLHNGRPVAGGMIVCFRETVEIPWASSLRKYNRFSPNMLLYWSFIEHASNEGFRVFDFGRSTIGEGTHKFKEQWKAKPYPLYWNSVSTAGKKAAVFNIESKYVDTASLIWKKIPVPIANWVGPKIRASISL